MYDLSRYVSSVSDLKVNNQLAAIGGRRIVLLLNLNEPSEPILSLRPPPSTHPLWENVVVCWNENPKHESTLASSNSRDLLLWNIEAYEKDPIIIQDANQRPITGVGFATENPNIIATSSMDSQVNLWDIRSLRGTSQSRGSFPHSELPRPIMILKEPGLPGASVLAWNRHNGYVLATAHANQLWLWDIRGGRGATAFRKTAASNSVKRKSGIPLRSTSISRIAKNSSSLSYRTLSRHSSFIHLNPALNTLSQTPFRSSNSTGALLRLDNTGIEDSSYLMGNFPRHESGSSGQFLLRCLTNHTANILDIAWSYHSQHALATASQDKTVKIWDFSAKHESDTTTDHRSEVVTSSGMKKSLSSCRDDLKAYESSAANDWKLEPCTDKRSHFPTFTPTKVSFGAFGSVEKCEHFIVGELSRMGQYTDVRQLRFTPFGRGIITISHAKLAEEADAPQTLRLWSLESIYHGSRQESKRGVWEQQKAPLQVPTGISRSDSAHDESSPKMAEKATPDMVCVFKGHNAPIVAFDWHSLVGASETAFGAALSPVELVSLDKDAQLRIHTIEQSMIKACDSEGTFSYDGAIDTQKNIDFHEYDLYAVSEEIRKRAIKESTDKDHFVKDAKLSNNESKTLIDSGTQNVNESITANHSPKGIHSHSLVSLGDLKADLFPSCSTLNGTLISNQSLLGEARLWSDIARNVNIDHAFHVKTKKNDVPLEPPQRLIFFDKLATINRLDTSKHVLAISGYRSINSSIIYDEISKVFEIVLQSEHIKSSIDMKEEIDMATPKQKNLFL